MNNSQQNLLKVDTIAKICQFVPGAIHLKNPIRGVSCVGRFNVQTQELGIKLPTFWIVDKTTVRYRYFSNKLVKIKEELKGNENFI